MAKGASAGSRVGIKDLFAAFQGAMLQRMESLERTVGELTKAVNTGQASLPREFMRREDCAAFHNKLAEQWTDWRASVQRQIEELQRVKADRGEIAAGITAGRVVAGVFIWIIATLLSIAGTTIAMANFVGGK